MKLACLISLLTITASANAQRPVVWCTHSTVKVFKETPAGGSSELHLELAHNEWESGQIVIRSDKPLRKVTFKLPTVKGLELSIRRVEYVPVREKTDPDGATGDYPDPLPPIEGPLDLEPGRNHVFWLTVHTTESAVDRVFEIVIAGVGKVTVRVHVWNFSLPTRLHTRTAYGVNPEENWYPLKTLEQRRELHDLVMQACRDYHISPFNPFRYHEIVEKDGALDFAEFDRAGKRYLDEFGFNSFVLDVPLDIYSQPTMTDEFREQLKKRAQPRLEHLQKMGWLDRAILYWIDEPQADKAEFVKQRMRVLAECMPGAKRILTVYSHPMPLPDYLGFVDVWVPIMNQIVPAAAAERQAKGEEIWWYVCTGPKGKYATNFIDRPALHHRIRYWMMASLHMDGDLYWSTTYWQHKNPWDDAMSYVAGDPKNKWGNGDGFLFYPPTRTPPTEPVIKPPVPSIRLAMIRDGLEDLEYLRLLRKRGNTELWNEAMKLVPSLTEFEQDPEKLLAMRHNIGEYLTHGK